ncbi:MAG: molybdate ABC transporter substrate-binding protein [Xanthobacteraceae bacterium]|nr:molybdate ABC transporter substrate-binding protein [Xanthobacteraceae bacterium]
MRTTMISAAGAALLCAIATSVSAAEIKVFSTIAVQSALEGLTPIYEMQSGDKLTISFATAAALAKRIQGGETADVLILTPPLLQSLAREDKAGHEVTPLVSSGISVVVKSDAERPDISTPDAFKQAILNAKSIAYSDPAAGGASGVYVAKMLERLGIADQVKDKTKHPPANGNAAVLVANGDAEIGIQQTPEVMAAPGITIVGILPGDLNNVTVFAAGLGVHPANKAAAEAFLKFLKSPRAVDAFRMRGLDPA